MSQNLPYMSIYKGDFLRCNVSACSIAAQGLWFRLMILMHDSERTGYLCLNNLPMPSRIAAVKCAVSVNEYKTLLAELMSVSAFSTSKEDIIFSPQIVAEANDRAKNAERQRRFKEKTKGNAEVTPKVTPEVTPNSHVSSSSSSSSTNINIGGGKKPQTAANSPPNESKEGYLDRKQLEHPGLNVRAVYDDFVGKCGSERYPNLKNTRSQFDKWLANEELPIEIEAEQKGYTDPKSGTGLI